MSEHSMQENFFSERLKALRIVMEKQGIDVSIIPSADPHLSEYLPEHWRSREWLSGFNGSAGTLIVGVNKSSLWVDSRYWSQAEEELKGTDILMCKIFGSSNIPYLKWILDNFSSKSIISINGYLISLNQGRYLKSELEKNGLIFRTDIDLVALVWKNRPALPEAKVYEHSSEFVAMSRQEKINLIRTHLKMLNADWHLMSSLDDIAWVLNLRGSDIEFNPVFISYMLIGLEKNYLMIDSKKVSSKIINKLFQDGIEVLFYDATSAMLQRLPFESTLLLDPQRTSYAMGNLVRSDIHIIESINPTVFLKSRKAELEIRHIRLTMVEDGASFCEFLSWLDLALVNKDEEVITELTIAEKIEMFRSSRPNYICASFGTIAGFNANGALPHYQATKDKFSIIKNDGLLLIDTGGQYLSGTTDMTRVIAIGIPGQEQKKDFTLVLKGLIALSETRFPRSTPAPMLDAIARKPLWDHGLDYGHGTGHGVGYFLNVHEGPQSISYHRKPEPETAMEKGMVTSIEPGLYKVGKWGIRLENLVANQACSNTEYDDFLYFETLTQCPIDTRCVDKSLLSENEISWLNHYHEDVRQKLMPYVSNDARSWLIRSTEPI